jgi:hypothetical protein
MDFFRVYGLEAQFLKGSKLVWAFRGAQFERNSSLNNLKTTLVATL